MNLTFDPRPLILEALIDSYSYLIIDRKKVLINKQNSESNVSKISKACD